MMNRLRSLLLLLVAATGCYSPNIADGQLACAPGGKCPEGFHCLPDNKCYKAGANPDCNPPCSGMTPACDKTTLKCVGCLADKDCPAGALCAMSRSCVPG